MNLISVTQAAKLSKSSKVAVIDAIKAGKIKGFKIGNAWALKKAEAEKYKHLRRQA